MKRAAFVLSALFAAACLAACSTATKFRHVQHLDPSTGKVASVETEVTAAEDKQASKAKRTVSVGADGSARMDFGTTEEAPGGSAEKVLGTALDKLLPFVGGGK